MRGVSRNLPDLKGIKTPLRAENKILAAQSRNLPDLKGIKTLVGALMIFSGWVPEPP